MRVSCPRRGTNLAILDLLNVSRGVVVITKRDLVDEELEELAVLDAQQLTEGTALKDAPVVVVSAVTGEGLSDLLSTIDTLLDSTSLRRNIGKPRLSIDRVFTMRGFGTVVTGTLIDGMLSLGQEVEILPTGQRTYIRGLETHRRKIDAALPGSRVAVNLTGISTDQLERGFVITTPGWLRTTRIVDVKLRAVTSLAQPVAHNATVTFHTGASETAGKVRLLDRERLRPGESGWAQVILDRRVAVAKGDLFVLRSLKGTVGGGEIVDPYAKRHPRFHSEVIESLQAREKGSPEDILAAILESKESAELERILPLCNIPQEEAQSALDTLVMEGRVVMLGSRGSQALLFSAKGWGRLVGETQMILKDCHRKFPLRAGMPREEFRSRLGIPSEHFASILQRLINEGILTEEGTAVRLPSHEVRLSAKQQAEVDTFLKALSQAHYSPPSGILPEPEILQMLARDRRVVKVSDDVVFSTMAYDEMVGHIIEHMKSNRAITVGEVRDMFHSSRRHALALMEYLDGQKITRRVGDERVLR